MLVPLVYLIRDRHRRYVLSITTVARAMRRCRRRRRRRFRRRLRSFWAAFIGRAGRLRGRLAAPPNLGSHTVILIRMWRPTYCVSMNRLQSVLRSVIYRRAVSRRRAILQTRSRARCPRRDPTYSTDRAPVAAKRTTTPIGRAAIAFFSILLSTIALSPRRLVLNKQPAVTRYRFPLNRTHLKRMSNIYRIFPVLWNDGICKQAQTVYAINRPSPIIPSTCSNYVREDPAYYWTNSNGNFTRILPPPASGSCCYQPTILNAVNWTDLPSWLSYVQSLGYTITSDLSSLKPYSDVWITGP